MPNSAPVHRPTHWKPKQQVRREHSAQTNPIYDATWRRLRNAHLVANPLCCECWRQKGILTAATQVHHVVPVMVDPSRRLDPTNLESICHACHSRITANAVWHHR